MTASDLDRVTEINHDNVPSVGDATREHLGRLLAESAIALVDEVDGRVIGFCLVFGAGADYDSVNYRWFQEHHPSSMYLDRVAFDPDRVGRGLGSAMYAEVDRRIRAEHPDAVGLGLEVNIDPPNEPSLAFHARQGFVEVGRQMSHGIEVSLQHRAV